MRLLLGEIEFGRIVYVGYRARYTAESLFLGGGGSPTDSGNDFPIGGNGAEETEEQDPLDPTLERGGTMSYGAPSV